MNEKLIVVLNGWGFVVDGGGGKFVYLLVFVRIFDSIFLNVKVLLEW